MAFQSPSKFATTDQDELVAVSNCLQLACSSCLDPSLTRDQLYRRVVDASSLTTTAMVRMVKLQRSWEKENEYLEKELAKVNKQIEELGKELKDPLAQRQFHEDEVSRGKMMAMALEVELLNMEKDAKVCSLKDFVEEVVLDEVDVDAASSPVDTDLVLE